MKRIVILLIVALGAAAVTSPYVVGYVVASLSAQEKPTAAATEVDELQLQVVLLKQQLAQAIASTAKCEAEGQQSAKVMKDANDSGQALVKGLDARGLTIDQQTGKIVAKPAEAPKVAETKKP